MCLQMLKVVPLLQMEVQVLQVPVTFKGSQYQVLAWCDLYRVFASAASGATAADGSAGAAISPPTARTTRG